MDQLERPSPTKRPRAPPDHVDDNDFLSRRALEVYNGAQRSGSHRMLAFSTPRPENELGTVEFDHVDEHFGPGSTIALDCDDHDHLNDSIRCTYMCRNMVNKSFLVWDLHFLLAVLYCSLLCTSYPVGPFDCWMDMSLKWRIFWITSVAMLGIS